MTGSDDGSKLYLNNRYIMNNDGLHGWRTRWVNRHMSRGGRNLLRVEYFERGGHAGCWFYYQGHDTRHRMVPVPSNVMEANI
jgi:hypothetical protein